MGARSAAEGADPERILAPHGFPDAATRASARPRSGTFPRRSHAGLPPRLPHGNWERSRIAAHRRGVRERGWRAGRASLRSARPAVSMAVATTRVARMPTRSAAVGADPKRGRGCSAEARPRVRTRRVRTLAPHGFPDAATRASARPRSGTFPRRSHAELPPRLPHIDGKDPGSPRIGAASGNAGWICGARGTRPGLVSSRRRSAARSEPIATLARWYQPTAGNRPSIGYCGSL